MSDDRYKIDFPLPDLGPAVSMFLAARNQHKANDRSDEYLGMERDAMKRNAERQSAQDVRDAAELKRKHDIEAYTQQDALFRKANKSVAAANMNPYGYKFDETRDLPANVEGPQLSPDAEAARFTPSPHETAPIEPEAPPQEFVGHELRANEEGPEQFPDAEQDRFAKAASAARPMTPTGYQPGAGMGAFGDTERQTAADNLASVGTGLHGAPPAPVPAPASTPSLDMRSMAAANAAGMEAPGPEGTRRVFANYQGQSFEVPEQSDKTPFGEKYDNMLKFYLDDGADPKEARRAVAAQYKADQTQAAIGGRSTATLAHQDTAREDRQTFDREMAGQYKMTAKTQEELAREKIRAMAAQAGQRAGTQAETSADRTINTYMGIAKEAKAAAGAKSDIAGMRPINRIMEELTNPDPVVQKTAIDSMASIAAGGKAPIAVLHALETPFGLVKTYENEIYRLAHGGMNMPSVNEAFRQAAVKLQKVSKEQRLNDFNAWEHAAGRSSRWYNPAMAPFVEDQRAATLDELGLSEADVGSAVPAQTTDMGINPGMGAATRPKGPSGRGGHMTPKAPAPSSMSDGDAVKMARERLARNPNDQVAKKVLQLHGLAQ